MLVTDEPTILTQHAIRTWFGIGGGADRFCQPRSVEELRRCIEIDPAMRVLGDGANLLVDDDGVGELVVELNDAAFTAWDIDAKSGRVRVGAGANLPKLINEAVRQGLGGIEGLAGIPATIGGALVMNAGGAFGQIADVVARVFALDRVGREVVLERSQIAFDYRASGLTELILTGAELQLTPGDAAALRTKQKDVMAYKKNSQPMADKSAGCCFKNPTLREPLKAAGIEAAAGQRVSAGMLIDKAGLKGLRVGGAEVSPRHANFMVTSADAKARDVIELMKLVQQRVRDALGVELHPEVVVWSRAS
ncbi:MAG: UDP-N-acetylmuramate dehydrogenase [Planctomycetota bacterium]|nr:UDP-N-acetylmuramate dehydrogenase [Planctomycetota bacterium]